MKLAGGNLFFARTVVAKLADPDAGVAFGVGRAERRPEDAAGHGPRRVEIAQAGGPIERRTGLFIGEVFEQIGAAFVQKPRWKVAGKGGADARDGLPRSLADSGGTAGVGGVESGETIAKACGVELRDGEDAHAALCASRSAEKPGAGTAGRVGNSRIDDLDELSVAGRNGHGIRIAG